MDLKQAREKLVGLRSFIGKEFGPNDNVEALDVAIKQLDIAIVFEETDDGNDEHEQDRDDLDKR